MYIPRYTITTQILKDIGAIEAAREVIENAPLVPAYEAKFRDEAKLKAAHYGTALEGNDLTEGEARLIMDRGVGSVDEAESVGIMARARDVQEVINYRNVLEFINRTPSLGKTPEEQEAALTYTKEILCDIHKLVVDRIVPKEETGIYRKSQVVLRNSITREIGFRPPSALEVPFLMDDFFKWINSDYGRKEHSILRAGITHYVLAAVHPFVEGNGRTARAMATMVLFAEGYDIKRFFALEEYFDKHASDYFGALMEVSNQANKLEERDLTPWLSVFTRALAAELVRIKETVRELSVDIKIKEKTGKQVTLSERQMKIVEYLNANGEITMAGARGILAMVSEDTILRDFKFLMSRGVLSKRGSTKAAKYILKR